MRSSKSPLAFGVAFALSALAVPAYATPTFPDVIRDALSAASSPDCTVCHAGATRRGTVTTPFGQAALSRGLQAYDDDSLRTALRALEGAGVDSDGDGVPDVQELRDGTDPNLGPDGDGLVTPEYGCNAAASAPEGALILALCVAAIGARTRRRATTSG